jgi:hypothetical protein
MLLKQSLNEVAGRRRIRQQCLCSWCLQWEHGSVLQLEALAQYLACKVGHGPLYISVLHNSRQQTLVTVWFLRSWSTFGDPVQLRSKHMFIFSFSSGLRLIKELPWPESASELYRPSDCRLSSKLVPTLADRGCCVVSAADPLCYSNIITLYWTPLIAGHITDWLIQWLTGRHTEFKPTPPL